MFRTHCLNKQFSDIPYIIFCGKNKKTIKQTNKHTHTQIRTSDALSAIVG